MFIFFMALDTITFVFLFDVCVCLRFIYTCLYLVEKTDRQQGVEEKSSICWFDRQMALKPSVGPGENLESGSTSG